MHWQDEKSSVLFTPYEDTMAKASCAWKQCIGPVQLSKNLTNILWYLYSWCRWTIATDSTVFLDVHKMSTDLAIIEICGNSDLSLKVPMTLTD